MKNMNGFLPLTLEEALLILKHADKNGRRVRIVAGGTDVMARGNGNQSFFLDYVLDIFIIYSIDGAWLLCNL